MESNYWPETLNADIIYQWRKQCRLAAGNIGVYYSSIMRNVGVAAYRAWRNHRGCTQMCSNQWLLAYPLIWYHLIKCNDIYSANGSYDALFRCSGIDYVDKSWWSILPVLVVSPSDTISSLFSLWYSLPLQSPLWWHWLFCYLLIYHSICMTHWYSISVLLMIWPLLSSMLFSVLKYCLLSMPLSDICNLMADILNTGVSAAWLADYAMTGYKSASIRRIRRRGFIVPYEGVIWLLAFAAAIAACGVNHPQLNLGISAILRGEGWSWNNDKIFNDHQWYFNGVSVTASAMSLRLAGVAAHRRSGCVSRRGVSGGAAASLWLAWRPGLCDGW